MSVMQLKCHLQTYLLVIGVTCSVLQSSLQLGLALFVMRLSELCLTGSFVWAKSLPETVMASSEKNGLEQPNKLIVVCLYQTD